MSWVKTVEYAQATGKLAKVYQRLSSDGYVDNIMKAHSLRPHTMEGHMHLYKNVLHHSSNKTPRWLIETLGVYVSRLNGCDYCVQHHFAGLKKLLGDDERAEKIMQSFITEEFEVVFDAREIAQLNYARLLTETPHHLNNEFIKVMREQGLSDEEIIEINQVVAYFCYANRTVLGLGVELDGDRLGLSPADQGDPDNWSHQ